MGRRIWRWAIFGAIGFGYGQGAILMWPEWSPWTWWAIATALIPLLFVPNLWDHRYAILNRVGMWRKRRVSQRLIDDLTNLLLTLREKSRGHRSRSINIQRIVTITNRYPDLFPEDAEIDDIRDTAITALLNIEASTGKRFQILADLDD